MMTNRFFAVAALAAGLLTASAARAAETESFMGSFGVEHGAASHPQGMVDVALDTKTNVMTYSVSWSGLSGPVIAAHFHGPAAPGQDAAPIVPVTGPFTSPLKGKVQLTAEQAAALEAGKVYFNLHTDKLPKGEARAQLVKE